MNDKTFTVYTDGGARGNPGEAAYGFIVYDQNKNIIFREGKKIGISTNNTAEYMGVISALSWIKDNLKKIDKIEFLLDSELVAHQLTGKYKVKNENLRNLFFTVKDLENKVNSKIYYKPIEREKNKEADKLVNMALDGII
ncbi:MAG: hypothetical protein A2857_07000 [Candidatus Levybacteria bacterium RIFCSPHIGHO2_01_FULL_36_15]|nr:MAG: hypothetical protein A2857_07000 [Candidatus Levybacteria bacterium RIFCSPHIGHO2_01_FULL_36_15]